MRGADHGRSDNGFDRKRATLIRLINEYDEHDVDRTLLDRMRGIVEPWVSSQSCRDASEQIKGNLIQHCQECERQLGGRTHPAKKTPLLFATGGVLALGLTAFAAIRPGELAILFERLQHSTLHVAQLVRGATVAEVVGVSAGVMLLFGWWMLRSVREV